MIPIVSPRKSEQKKSPNKKILVRGVKDYEIKSDSVTSIVNDMGNSGGFESTNLSVGTQILRKMGKEIDKLLLAHLSLRYVPTN